MQQPDESPEWATDEDYPAGTDPWSASDTKVEPSTGQKATGFVPGTKPPAQRMNWWMNLVARHVEALREQAALNWTAEVTANVSQPFTNAKLIRFGEYLVGVLNTTVASSRDLVNWAQGGGSYGGSGPLSDLVTNGTTVVVLDDGSSVMQTANRGGSFSAAGTLPNLDSNNYHKLGWFNGVWCAMTADKLATDADLSGTWTDQNSQIPASWSGVDPLAIKASPTELLVLPDVSASKPVLRTTNGTTFAAGGSIATSQALAGFAHNEVLGQWLAVNVSGDTWLSDDGGLNWTAGPALALEETVVAVESFGRGWAIACTGRVWICSPDLSSRKRVLMPPSAGSWSHLVRYSPGFSGGNIAAVSRLVLSGGSGDILIRGSNWSG